MPEVTITEREPTRIAAIHHIGPYPGIAEVFGRLGAWAGPAGLIGPDTRFLGIYYDNPREVPAEQLRSHACLTLAGDPPADRPEEVQVLDLPGGRHALVRHTGPYENLEQTYDWIFGEWLPQSGETITAASFEDYINDPREVPPEQLITDIYVPIGPATGAT